MSSSRQLAAIMFTDIVGYSALMGMDEQKAFDILNKNRQIQKPIIEECNGRWIKEMGDGVMASFNNVSDAVNAAIRIQESCKTTREFELRIGIHLGEVVFENGDVFGDGVNIASRIQSVAQPGSIFVSEPVHHNVVNKKNILTKFVKEVSLKNINSLIKIYEILVPSGEFAYQVDSPLTKKSPEKSIVVLPFVNMSNDADQEYFSDGLTEEIITDLSQIKELRVISRASAMTFKGSNKKIREIAAEAGVVYVLEGSVRKSGNNLRIVAQLINAEEDEHIWAEKYTGTLDDIFAIQENVSRQIAATLKIKLSQKESELLSLNPIKNLHAYELHQRARYEFFRFKEDGLNRALKYLNDALKLEGENSLLYARLGLTYINLLNVSDSVEKEYLEKAKFFASKAFELDPTSLGGHVLLGWIHFLDGDLRNAANYLKKAFLTNPNDPDVLLAMILAHFYIGLPDEIEKASAVLMKIDPLNPVYYVLQGFLHYTRGELSEAFEDSKTAYEIYPEIPQNQLYYAYYLACMNYYKEASAVLDQLVHNNTDTIFRPLGLLLRSALVDSERNQHILSEKDQAKLRIDCEWSWMVADAYSLMGEKEKAIDWLEYVVQRGFVNYLLFSQYDPFLENIRNEKRFQKLMEFTKNEWEKISVDYQ